MTGVIEVHDPRTGELVGTVADCGPDDIGAAVGKARSAFGLWGRLSYAQRAEHLLGVRDLMLDRLDDIVDVIVSETGKPRSDAVASEIVASCELVDYYARNGGHVLADEKVSPGLLFHKRARIRYEPMGVVGVISPWNYPFVLAFGPVITALFAGNTVVLKPSEITPLTGVEIGKLFTEVGAHAGIVEVVTGGGAAGEALVRSGVDKLAFTGSAATGRRVMAAAADTLTPVLLELGGKDPMVVLDDADVERAANGAVWGAFANAGQTCMAVERVYVADAVYDQFVTRVTERTVRLRTGVDGDVGPVTAGRQLEIIEDHVADAVARGAAVLTGGRRLDGPGSFYEPTVMVDVDHSMKIMRDETFGPVMPIMRVADDDEALRLANDSVYGLNSSVWTSNADRASRFVEGIEAGNVCVNDCMANYAVGALPFGGVKDSGFGRSHGAAGLREFSVTKAVLVDRPGLRREVNWYPVPGIVKKALPRVARLRYRRGWRNKLRGG